MDKKEIAKKRKNDKRHKKIDPSKLKDEDKAPVKKNSEDTLPSNWAKYEVNEQLEEVSEGANFKTLLDEPLSQDAHFKFKNEESWSKNVEFHSQFQKYFTIDINLLSSGISCIPFSKRHGYDSTILQTLDEDTEKNIMKYQNYLDKRYAKLKTTNYIKPKEYVQEIETENEEKYEQNVETIENQVENLVINTEYTLEIEEVSNENTETNDDLVKKDESINLVPKERRARRPVREVEQSTEDIIKEETIKESSKDTEINKIKKSSAVDMNPKVSQDTIEVEETSKPVVQNQRRNSKLEKPDDEELDSLLKGGIVKEEEPTLIDDDPLMKTTAAITKNIIPNSTADLEQWLDDILDD